MEGSNCQRGLVFIIGFLSLGMILSIDKCERYRLYPLIINQIPSTLEMTLFLVKDRPFCNWWHLFRLVRRIIFKNHLFKTDVPFRFCKIGLRNTLFIFGRKNGRLFVCFVATLSDFGLLF